MSSPVVDASRAAPPDPGSAARSSADPRSRFLARLEELKDVVKDSHAEETAHQVEATTKNRKRVRTAVRRLLTERLFAADLNIRSNKTNIKNDPGYYRQDKDRQIAAQNVQYVCGCQRSSLHQRCHGNDGQHLKAANHVHIIKNLQSNRRSPPDPGRQPRVLPLLPSVGGRHRSTCSHCWSHQLTAGWAASVRDGQTSGGPPAPKVDMRCLHTVQSKAVPSREADLHLDTRVNWHRNSVDLALTSSLPPSDGHPSHRTALDRFNEDLHLRKLLEELYRDKKYMDKLINTSGADRTEDQVCGRLKVGRDYLLQRAHFWLQKGALPPRPPATDLGLRLQNLQTITRGKSDQTLPPTDPDVAHAM